MSNLDDICNELFMNEWVLLTEEEKAYCKQQIKDLMYKIYDEDFYTFKKNLEAL